MVMTKCGLQVVLSPVLPPAILFFEQINIDFVSRVVLIITHYDMLAHCLLDVIGGSLYKTNLLQSFFYDILNRRPAKVVAVIVSIPSFVEINNTKDPMMSAMNWKKKQFCICGRHAGFSE